jgi:hypothetical protein
MCTLPEAIPAYALIRPVWELRLTSTPLLVAKLPVGKFTTEVGGKGAPSEKTRICPSVVGQTAATLA